HLAIVRAGASTCSELAACGKAAILVPLPTSAHDHQKQNALSVVRGGAAVMLEERDLTGQSLAETILALCRDPGRLAAMQEAQQSLSRPDAAARIVDVGERVGAWRWLVARRAA